MSAGFLEVPDANAEAQGLFDQDIAQFGYVTNGSRLWAYQAATHDRLFDLMQQQITALGLTTRLRGILVTACASTLGDSYCSLAWGNKLAAESDPRTAAGVIRGDDSQLTARERALAGWARKVARDANHISEADTQALRDVGYSDAEIFAVTTFVALRIAYATINDALGARPDAIYRSSTPEALLDAISYGRPIAEEPPVP